MKIEGVIE